VQLVVHDAGNNETSITVNGPDGSEVAAPTNLAISADGKTPHQAVVTAMDAAGKLGFSHLRMTTVEAAQGTP